MAQKSILVTGGTGLVGAYVVGMLQERGERPVIFDVAVNERLLRAVGVDPASVETVRGDILDLPQLVSAIRDYDVGQVIHLAAFLGEEVQRRPYTGVRLNLMGTVNVLEAVRLEGVPRITFPSSGTVYLGSMGEGLPTVDETIPINPPSVYAATKGGCEFLGNAYARMYGFEFVCIRYVGGLYGPSPTTMKATREQAIQDMIRAALKREDTVINWPYGPTEILYGKDAARATVLAALKPEHKDRLFHIGCSGMVTGDDILAALKKEFPESGVTLQKGSDPMSYPANRALTDLSRASEQLGFDAEYTLDKAIADYAETMRKLEGL